MILDGPWKQRHQSWPHTPGCRACRWLHEDSRHSLTSWACDRSAHLEICSIRTGTRPSQRRHDQMCLKEQSFVLSSRGMFLENVLFVLHRSWLHTLRLRSARCRGSTETVPQANMCSPRRSKREHAGAIPSTIIHETSSQRI